MGLRGVSGAASAETDERERGGQLVVVRPAVVETGGHICGNLFQRIYHSIERLRAGEGAAATDLEGSARQLEQALQLLLDYVSPYEPALQSVQALDVVRSLASQLADLSGSQVAVGAKLPAESLLLVDAGRVARAFRLLAARVNGDARGGGRLDLTAVVESKPALLRMTLHAPQGGAPARSTLADLEWAVAERLLEIHGGTLLERAGDSGEVYWEIVLPLQP